MIEIVVTPLLSSKICLVQTLLVQARYSNFVEPQLLSEPTLSQIIEQRTLDDLMSGDLGLESNRQISSKARPILNQEAKETPWSAEETLQFALVIFLSCFQDGFPRFFFLFFFLVFFFLFFLVSFLSSSAL